MKTLGYIIETGLHRGEADLILREVPIPKITDDQVLVEPLIGCWEGNMTHALQRRPIDVCRYRKEPWVILGNAGVVRVVECGPKANGLHVGQKCIVFGAGDIDSFGYMKTAYGYDQAGSRGILAKRTILLSRQLIPLPENTSYSDAQWAAFSLRYITAWANWKIAYGTWQLIEPDRVPIVWGWGGGVAFAELGLARRNGCPATLISSDDSRLLEIRNAGLEAVDRRAWGKLSYDEESFKCDIASRSLYSIAEAQFMKEIMERTNGSGVSIFLDYVGSPVYPATLKALGRPGIIATAGWKHGMKLAYNRAVECISHHMHLNTHFARRGDALDAVDYGEKNNWIPPEQSKVWSWNEIPELARSYSEGKVSSYFPLYSVNES